MRLIFVLCCCFLKRTRPFLDYHFHSQHSSADVTIPPKTDLLYKQRGEKVTENTTFPSWPYVGLYTTSAFGATVPASVKNARSSHRLPVYTSHRLSAVAAKHLGVCRSGIETFVPFWEVRTVSITPVNFVYYVLVAVMFPCFFCG